MEFFKIVLNLPEILSTFYAILMIVGYVPGLMILLKSKDLTGVGRYFWFLIIVTVGISFHNLILTESNNFQIYAVGLNLLMGVVCLTVYLIKTRSGKVMLDIIIFVILVGLYTKFLADELLITQTVASISIILAYIGQIRTYYKVKTSTGTSKWMFLIMGTGLLCLILSMTLTDTYPHIIATEAFNFILVMVCYLQANYYERRGLENEKDTELRKNP